MKQASLGDKLSAWLINDMNVRCTVRHQASGDTNYPSWSVVDTDVELCLQQASTRSRLSKDDMYDESVTHDCHAVENDAFVVGARLEVTHERIDGEWVSTEGNTYAILGIYDIPRLPEWPDDHVQMDLWVVE